MGGDIPARVGAFILPAEVGGLSAAGIKRRARPMSVLGNRNSMERILHAEDLPRKMFEESKGPETLIPEKPLSLKELEKRYVLKVLQETSGNKKKASQILGIDRVTLYRIIEKEGL